MKVALVHDYLNEFGGAERVLLVLSEIWPKAPIYTAFYKEGSPAYVRFKGKKIITSWAQKIPFFSTYLHSPLRFLAPLIWNSFVRQLTDYDVVITSSSWYITKGIAKRQTTNDKRKPVEICYCHTPPRYLYGYKTSFNWQKFWPIRLYALFVNHFLRVYDFEAAQRVDWFIANSCEVQGRIKKFYRRESEVIYPPVDIKKFTVHSSQSTVKQKKSVNRQLSTDYFLVVSRLVASKNVDIAVETCAKLGLPLKVVGTGRELENLKRLADVTPNLSDRSKMVKNGNGSTIEFLGDVSDEQLITLYQNCRAVIFAASQEDFGLVPVEAMAAGRPVIANAEGGVLESVVDWSVGGRGRCTGVYFDPPTVGSLTLAINNFMRLEKQGYFEPKFISAHAQKFSKDRFKKQIETFVKDKAGVVKK